MSTDVIHVVILAVLLPLWIGLGLADWQCHRKADIAHTAGPAESVLHLIGAGIIAMAVLPGLFLDINALVLAVMVVAFVGHEITVTLDIKRAASTRLVTTLEQRLHDYMTAMPVMLLALILSTHGGQAAALIGMGSETADFHVRLKDPHLPTAYLIGWIAAAVLFNLLPFIEELMRGLRAKRRPRPTA
jgi:ABC-type dipeptide/oligopeptide/nickel transport system permease subunit